MRMLLIVQLSLVVLSAQACEADPSQEYKLSDGISMQIPAGWVPIPQNVVAEYSRLSQQGIPASVDMTVQAGFQPSTNSTWMQTPYVMVYVRTKRVPERELRNYKTINQRLKREASKIDPSTSTLDIDSPIYEPETHILWIKASDPTGPNRIAGMRLTNQGTVMMSLFYDGDEKKYSPILEQMVRSIGLREGLEYEDSGVSGLEYALLAAPIVVSILIWLVLRPYYAVIKREVAPVPAATQQPGGSLGPPTCPVTRHNNAASVMARISYLHRHLIAAVALSFCGFVALVVIIDFDILTAKQTVYPLLPFVLGAGVELKKWWNGLGRRVEE